MRRHGRLLLLLGLCLGGAVPGAAQGGMPGLPVGIYACLRPAHHPVTNRQTLIPIDREIRILSYDAYTLSDPALTPGSYTFAPADRVVHWHSGALRGITTHFLVFGTQPPTLVLVKPWGRRSNWLCVRRHS